MADDTPRPWTVTARNLAEHFGNRIHTDEGAREQGFPSALVAGVTTYAYLTHPVVAAWGTEWLTRGGGEMRFHAPVFAARPVDCVPEVDPSGAVTVEAVDPTEELNPRATLAVVRDSGPPPDRRDGDALESRRYVLDGRYGCDYGARAGDDLELYEREGIVHPAVWPAIANNVFSTDLVRGSWIHTRSIVRHHDIAPRGATVDVHAVVVDRFVRHGERAVVDIVIERDGRPIATLEHEAIIDLSVA
jgi:acyl dehydratase